MTHKRNFNAKPKVSNFGCPCWINKNVCPIQLWGHPYYCIPHFTRSHEATYDLISWCTRGGSAWCKYTNPLRASCSSAFRRTQLTGLPYKYLVHCFPFLQFTKLYTVFSCSTLNKLPLHMNSYTRVAGLAQYPHKDTMFGWRNLWCN